MFCYVCLFPDRQQRRDDMRRHQPPPPPLPQTKVPLKDSPQPSPRDGRPEPKRAPPVAPKPGTKPKPYPRGSRESLDRLDREPAGSLTDSFEDIPDRKTRMERMHAVPTPLAAVMQKSLEREKQSLDDDRRSVDRHSEDRHSIDRYSEDRPEDREVGRYSQIKDTNPVVKDSKNSALGSRSGGYNPYSHISNVPHEHAEVYHVTNTSNVGRDKYLFSYPSSSIGSILSHEDSSINDQYSDNAGTKWHASEQDLFGQGFNRKGRGRQNMGHSRSVGNLPARESQFDIQESPHHNEGHYDVIDNDRKEPLPFRDKSKVTEGHYSEIPQSPKKGPTQKIFGRRSKKFKQNQVSEDDPVTPVTETISSNSSKPTNTAQIKPETEKPQSFRRKLSRFFGNKKRSKSASSFGLEEQRPLSKQKSSSEVKLNDSSSSRQSTLSIPSLSQMPMYATINKPSKSQNKPTNVRIEKAASKDRRGKDFNDSGSLSSVRSNTESISDVSDRSKLEPVYEKIPTGTLKDEFKMYLLGPQKTSSSNVPDSSIDSSQLSARSEPLNSKQVSKSLEARKSKSDSVDRSVCDNAKEPRLTVGKDEHTDLVKPKTSRLSDGAHTAAENQNFQNLNRKLSSVTDEASIDLTDLAGVPVPGMYKLDFDTSVSSSDRHDITDSEDVMQLLQIQDTDLERFSELSSGSSELVLPDERLSNLSLDSGEYAVVGSPKRENAQTPLADMDRRQTEISYPDKGKCLPYTRSAEFIESQNKQDVEHKSHVYVNEPIRKTIENPVTRQTHHNTDSQTLMSSIKTNESLEKDMVLENNTISKAVSDGNVKTIQNQQAENIKLHVSTYETDIDNLSDSEQFENVAKQNTIDYAVTPIAYLARRKEDFEMNTYESEPFSERHKENISEHSPETYLNQVDFKRYDKLRGNREPFGSSSDTENVSDTMLYENVDVSERSQTQETEIDQTMGHDSNVNENQPFEESESSNKCTPASIDTSVKRKVGEQFEIGLYASEPFSSKQRTFRSEQTHNYSEIHNDNVVPSTTSDRRPHELNVFADVHSPADQTTNETAPQLGVTAGVPRSTTTSRGKMFSSSNKSAIMEIVGKSTPVVIETVVCEKRSPEEGVKPSNDQHFKVYEEMETNIDDISDTEATDNNVDHANSADDIAVPNTETHRDSINDYDFELNMYDSEPGSRKLGHNTSAQIQQSKYIDVDSDETYVTSETKMYVEEKQELHPVTGVNTRSVGNYVPDVVVSRQTATFDDNNKNSLDNRGHDTNRYHKNKISVDQIDYFEEDKLPSEKENATEISNKPEAHFESFEVDMYDSEPYSDSHKNLSSAQHSQTANIIVNEAPDTEKHLVPDYIEESPTHYAIKPIENPSISVGEKETVFDKGIASKHDIPVETSESIRENDVQIKTSPEQLPEYTNISKTSDAPDNLSSRDSDPSWAFGIDNYDSEPFSGFGRRHRLNNDSDFKQKDDSKDEQVTGITVVPKVTQNITSSCLQKEPPKEVMDFFTKPAILEEFQDVREPAFKIENMEKGGSTKDGVKILYNRQSNTANTGKENKLPANCTPESVNDKMFPSYVDDMSDHIYENIEQVKVRAAQLKVNKSVTSNDPVDENLNPEAQPHESEMETPVKDLQIPINQQQVENAKRSLHFTSNKPKLAFHEKKSNLPSNKIVVSKDDDIEFSPSEFYKEPEKPAKWKGHEQQKESYSPLVAVQSRIIAGNLSKPSKKSDHEKVDNSQRGQDKTGHNVEKDTCYKDTSSIKSGNSRYSNLSHDIRSESPNCGEKQTKINEYVISSGHTSQDDKHSAFDSSTENLTDISLVGSVIPSRKAGSKKVRPGVIHMLNPCPSGCLTGGLKSKEKIEIVSPENKKSAFESNVSVLDFDLPSTFETSTDCPGYQDFQPALRSSGSKESFSNLPATNLLCKRVWKYPLKKKADSNEKTLTDNSDHGEDCDSPGNDIGQREFDAEINKGPLADSGEYERNEHVHTKPDSSSQRSHTYDSNPSNSDTKVADFIMHLPDSQESIESRYKALGLGNVTIDDTELKAQELDRQNIEFIDKENSFSDSEPSETDSDSSDEIELASFEMPVRHTDLDTSFDTFDSVHNTDGQVAIDCSFENVKMYSLDDFAKSYPLCPETYQTGIRKRTLDVPEVFEEIPFKTTKSNLKKRAKSDSSLERKVRFEANLPVYKSNQNMSTTKDQSPKTPHMFINTNELEKMQKLEQFITCLFDAEPKKLGKPDSQVSVPEATDTKVDEHKEKLSVLDKKIQALEDLEAEAYKLRTKDTESHKDKAIPAGVIQQPIDDYKVQVDDRDNNLETDIDEPDRDETSNNPAAIHASVCSAELIDNRTAKDESKPAENVISYKKTSTLPPKSSENMFKHSNDSKNEPVINNSDLTPNISSNKDAEWMVEHGVQNAPKQYIIKPDGVPSTKSTKSVAPKEVTRYCFTVDDSDEESPSVKTVTYEYVTEYKLNNVKIQYQKNTKTQTEDKYIKEAEKKYKPKHGFASKEIDIVPDNKPIIVEQVIEKSICYPLGPIYGVPSSYYDSHKEYPASEVQEEVDRSMKKDANTVSKISEIAEAALSKNVNGERKPVVVKNTHEIQAAETALNNDKTSVREHPTQVKQETVQSSAFHEFPAIRSKLSRSATIPASKQHVLEHDSKKYVWRSVTTNIPFEETVLEQKGDMKKSIASNAPETNKDKVIAQSTDDVKAGLTESKGITDSMKSKHPPQSNIPRIQINDEEECSYPKHEQDWLQSESLELKYEDEMIGNESENEIGSSVAKDLIDVHDEDDISLSSSMNVSDLNISDDEAMAAVMQERLPNVTVGEQTEERLLAVQALAVIGLGAVLLFLLPYV